MIQLFTLEGIQKKAGGVRHHQARVDERPVSLGAAGRRAAAGRCGASSSASASTPAAATSRPLIDAVKARSRTILQVAEQVAVRLDPVARDRSTPRARR